MKLETRIKKMQKALLAEAERHRKERHALVEAMKYSAAMDSRNKEVACTLFAAMLADLLEEHEQGKRDG